MTTDASREDLLGNRFAIQHLQSNGSWSEF
jgi:hypothetical protein